MKKVIVLLVVLSAFLTGCVTTAPKFNDSDLMEFLTARIYVKIALYFL